MKLRHIILFSSTSQSSSLPVTSLWLKMLLPHPIMSLPRLRQRWVRFSLPRHPVLKMGRQSLPRSVRPATEQPAWAMGHRGSNSALRSRHLACLRLRARLHPLSGTPRSRTDNMERFMPPFASLSDQQRWDVVAYAMTLHTSKDELAKGKELFEANCANCSTDFFKDQSKMSALSEVELARIIKQGNEEVNAFGSNLSDDDMWAVSAYLRTLAFDTAPVASAPACHFNA